MADEEKCPPTQHNYVQLGTKDGAEIIIICTKCGDVRKIQ